MPINQYAVKAAKLLGCLLPALAVFVIMQVKLSEANPNGCDRTKQNFIACEYLATVVAPDMINRFGYSGTSISNTMRVEYGGRLGEASGQFSLIITHGVLSPDVSIEKFLKMYPSADEKRISDIREAQVAECLKQSYELIPNSASNLLMFS